MTEKLNKVLAMVLAIALIFAISTFTSFAEDTGTDDQTANTDIVRGLSLSYSLKDSTDFIDLEEPYEVDGINFNNKYEKLSPKTGDERNILMWLYVTLAALIAIAILSFIKRRIN